MDDHRLKHFGITHELHQKLILKYIERLQNSTLSPNQCATTINDALLDVGLPGEDIIKYTSKLETFGCTTTEMLFLMQPDWFQAAGISNDLHVEALLKYLYPEVDGASKYSVTHDSYDASSTAHCKHLASSEEPVISSKNFQGKREWYVNCDCMILITLIEFLCLVFSTNPRERLFLFILGTLLLMTKSYYLSF